MKTPHGISISVVVAVAMAVAGLLVACSPTAGNTTPPNNPTEARTLGPTQTPSAMPTATACVSPEQTGPAAAPTQVALATPAVLVGGTHRQFQTAADVTYVTKQFRVPFTVRPGAGWWVANNINTLVSFEFGRTRPAEDLIQFVIPTDVVLQSGLIAAPSDVLAWLKALPYLDLCAPTPITVGGISGSMVEGGLRPGAHLNPEGIVNLICGELSECGWEGGQLIALAPGALAEFIQLDVRGMPVIISMGRPHPDVSGTWEPLDALLATVAFPSP
jgi:hypothetical protein